MTITAPQPGATVLAGATVRFSVDESATAIECSFDGGAFALCGGGTSGDVAIPADLAAGPHQAAVRATDVAGNQSAPATVGFALDTTELAVRFVPRITSCVNERIALVATVSGATFTCSLDGAAAAACSSPVDLPATLASGTHTIVATAAAGGATASSSLTFVIDTSQPAVHIAGIAPAPDAAGKADPTGRILFTSNKTVSARCSLDGHAVECSSPDLDGSFGFADLDDAGNPHDFTLTATDLCGNVTSASLQLDVDSTPPEPCLTDGAGCLAAPPTTGSDGEVMFAAEPGTYSCVLLTTTVLFKTPPETKPPLGVDFPCSPGQPIELAGLSDFGDDAHPYSLIVEGTDLHGNASRTVLTFLVGTTAPSVKLGAVATDPARGTLVVPYTVAPAGAEVTFTTCSLDGQPCDCSAGAATCSRVSAGAHQLTVAARDALGRAGAPSSRSGTMTYGPEGGRAILLGFDMSESNEDAAALLAAAVTDVPWKVSGAFDRPVRVVAFEAGTFDLAERQNIDAVLVGLVDGDGSMNLTTRDPRALAAALPGRDVLLVLDQNDPASAKATGDAWGADPTLRDFLDAGGVVVVLDGWRPGSLRAAPSLSATYQVLGGGATPILAVTSATDTGTMGRPWQYAPTTTELVFGVPSELMTSLNPSPADGTVSFTLAAAEHARPVYFSGNFGSTEAVVEKVFPDYAMSIAVTPDAPFTIESSLSAEAVAAVQCVLTVPKCQNLNGCCSGDDPFATTCACQAVDEAAHTFARPARSGSYTVDGRILSPPARPGRTAEAIITVPGPAVTLAEVGLTGRFCFRGVALDGSPMPLADFHPQVFDGTRLVDATAGGPEGCPDARDVGSVSACAGTVPYGGQVSVMLHVVDAAGNFGDVALANQQVPGCP